ncbi:pilin N-terminal domain-containing protein [Lacticaseibacillus thailandensis]|nr:pilin N-terminal domain-containing protein [Lacticaseibacillus thailandensis]
MTKLRWLVVTILAVLGLTLMFMVTQPVAAETTTTVTIHKRLYHSRDELPSIANQGTELATDHAALANSVGLNGVRMTVYDATEYLRDFDGGLDRFVQVYGNGDMTATAMADVAAKQELPVAADVTTATSSSGERGVASFPVARVRDGQPTAYFIVEDADTAGAANVDVTSLPGMLVVPNMYSTSTAALHIYPKNVAYQRDPYFFKIGRQANGTESRLTGAAFVVRRQQAGSWQYLAAEQDNLQELQWVTSTQPQTDAKLRRFTSGDHGLLTTGEIMFPAGDYQWVEVTAPDGYQLLEQPVAMTVPTSTYHADGTYNPVVINGQAVTETSSGSLTAAIIQRGRPYVYNNAKTTTVPETGGTTPGLGSPTSTTGPARTGTTATGKATRGWLPQLGQYWSVLAVIIGLGMIGLAIIWRRRLRRATVEVQTKNAHKHQ